MLLGRVRFLAMCSTGNQACLVKNALPKEAMRSRGTRPKGTTIAARPRPKFDLCPYHFTRLMESLGDTLDAVGMGPSVSSI